MIKGLSKDPTTSPIRKIDTIHVSCSPDIGIEVILYFSKLVVLVKAKRTIH